MGTLDCFLMTSELLKQKAREICYAIIRVSYFIKRGDLRQGLERLSFEFLEYAAMVSAGDKDVLVLNKFFSNISALDALVRIGHSLYEIEPINATILIRELDSYNSAMRQFGNAANKEESFDLESLFSKSSFPITKKDKDGGAIAVVNNHNLQVDSSDIKLNSSNGSLDGGITIRQNTIVEKIRQFNNRQSMNNDSAIAESNSNETLLQGVCRLKDILILFPEVSERTLRYDLQRLCEQGVIERVGSGGPASYYRITSKEGQDKVISV